jgi:Putative Flp pilus-assembly TadE/G-like
MNRIVGRRVAGGSVLIYATFSIVLILALCILGVDWGRVTVAKAELKTAADAAVRAGGMKMLEGAPMSDVFAAANQIIAQNKVDGVNARVRANSVQIGVYLPATKKFYPTNDPAIANAISVQLEHRFSESSLPLIFASIFNNGDNIVRTESMVMVSDVPGSFDVKQFTVNTPGSQTNTPGSTNTVTTNTNNTQTNNTNTSSNQSNTKTDTKTQTKTTTTKIDPPANVKKLKPDAPKTGTSTTTTKTNTTKTNTNTNTQSNNNQTNTNSNNSSSTKTTTTPGSSTSTPGSSQTVTVKTQTPGSGKKLVTIK